MDLTTLTLIAKSLIPTIKEFILGKQTLNEVLHSNMVASILIGCMIVMSGITIYISNVSNARLAEIVRLKGGENVPILYEVPPIAEYDVEEEEEPFHPTNEHVTLFDEEKHGIDIEPVPKRPPKSTPKKVTPAPMPNPPPRKEVRREPPNSNITRKHVVDKISRMR